VNDPSNRIEQVRSRRRIVMRVGLLVIVAASATACIFDQSDYKGGGRLDKGATASAPTATTTPTTTDTGSSTATSPTSSPLDSGLGD
jgi:hypothetical protein